MAMAYTAYLGGKMVYSHRVGVEPEGVRIHASPEIVAGGVNRAASTAMHHATSQMRQSAGEIRDGKLAPALRKRGAQVAEGTRPH